MLIHQTVSLNSADLKFASNEGEFTGYGSVFGVVDTKNDIVMPGAYTEFLKSGTPVPVYVNHGWLRGELPIGSWSDLKEDKTGLLGKANLVMKMQTASDAYWSVKSGLVNGLSVAIMPDPKHIERRSDGVRLIHSIKAMKEISIVNDPANDESRIIDVKYSDEIESIETVRDFERFLRDSGIVSKSASELIVARAKLVFGQGELVKNSIDDKAMKQLVDRLENFKI